MLYVHLEHLILCKARYRNDITFFCHVLFYHSLWWTSNVRELIVPEIIILLQ